MTTRLERLRERFDSDPGDRATFDALEESHFLQGEWEALVPIYERHLAAIEASSTPIDRARLLYRLGHALDEAGGRPERTEECLRQALAIDARFAPALRRLRARCAATGRWEEALELAAREADGVSRPTERAALLAEVGEGALHAGAPALAAVAFEQALAADAASRRAWLGLGEALEQTGRFADAAARWRQALALALLDGRERSAAWRRLGRLLAEELGDPAAALAVYEAAHQAAPEEAEWPEAMAAILRALGRGEALVTLAERRLALAGDDARRAAIALETGRALLASDDPAAARRWLQQAANAREDGDTHLALAEAAGRAGDTSGRTWHLERAMELGAEIPSWSDLGLGGAAPEAPGAARLAELRRAATACPEDADGLAALADALEAGHHDLERVEVLERLAALVSDPAERADHLLHLGALHETLDDAEAAAAAYRMAFDGAPARPEILAALERVLRKLERPDTLIELYARAAEAAPPPRRAALLAATGALRLDRGELEAARAAFAAALAADPACAAAHEGAARAATAAGDEDAVLDALLAEAGQADLERLETLAPELARRLGGLGRSEEALPALRRHAALSPAPRAALERLADELEALGNTDELSLVLERLDDLLEGVERGANQRRLAWLHAAEGRGDAALDAWRAALRHDPADTASLEALLDALSEAERDQDVLALLDELGAPAAGRPVARHRARALERVGRPGEAAAVWRALVADGESGDDALAAWERTARAGGDAASLVEALAERAERCEDADLRALHLVERARLLEDELAREPEARAAWEALVETSLPAPLTGEVERRLDALLERRGDFAALCDRLEARAERAPVEQACRLHARLADLAETELGDVGRARRHLELAVAVAPDQPDAWRRLAALYDEETWPAECLRALEGELAALASAGAGDQESAARRLALHARAARITGDLLGDVERATGHWRSVLALAPGHPEAGERLLARAEAAGAWTEVVSLLEGRLERLAGRVVDAERATDLCLRIADLLATRLDRRAEAVAVLEAAPAASAAPVAERLAALYTELGRNEELSALSEACADAAGDARERARWRHRLGDARRAAGDRAGAERAYEAALADAPDAEEVRRALCELFRSRGEHARLAAQLEASLRRAGPRAAAVERELAELFEGPLAAPERALEHWGHLVSLDPSADEPRDRAVAIARALGRDEQAVALLRGAAGDARTGPARAHCWALCAELLAGPLARPDEAVAAWREALRLEPERRTLRYRLRCTLESLGRPEEALAELREEWRAAEGEERIALAAYGADLAAGAHPGSLAPWLARLVADAPDDAELWEAIAGLHRRGGRFEACAQALAEAARCAVEPPRRAALHRERAVLLEGRLAAPGPARAAFEAALAEDPADADALAALDRLHAAAGRPRERFEVLRVRLAGARFAAQRAALAGEAAPLASALGERDEAADLWLAALGSLPGVRRKAALAPAGDALRAAGRDGAWAELAEEELGSTGVDDARAVSLRRALTRTWARLGHPERALAHARALVDGGPASDDDQRWLLALLRAEGDGAERARRLAAWARQAADRAERRSAWAELARLREERLGLPGAAAEAWREVLLDEPDAADAWSGLRRCAERTRDWPELARALEAEIEREPGPAADRWRRLGRVRWQGLGDAAGAERALLAARAAEPDELTALRLLQEIGDATGDFERSLAWRREEIDLLGDADPPRRRSLWLACAAIASRQAPDPALAATAWETADGLGPLDATGLAGWAAALASLARRDRWCEVFTRWCDHPDARPNAADWLALAQALAERGQRDEARARLATALAGDPALAPGWRLQAELCEADGDPAGAAEGWLRAAGLEESAAAAEAGTRGARHLIERDPARALAALERAVERAPDYAPGQAALAPLAEREGRPELAQAAALRLLSAEAAASEVAPDARLAALLAGARSARRLERWSAAWQLGGEALASAPGSPDALAARGLAAFHLGATGECQRELAARLALPDPDPSRTQLLVALARALETSGELEAALARHEEALALEPAHEDAHAGRLGVLERLGRRNEAAGAMAAWAAYAGDPARRAERYVRAARLARLAGSAFERVEGWLREALAADPSHATAWYELATGLWDEQRVDDAFAAAGEGVVRVASASVRAVLEALRGRVLEARDQPEAALAAYRQAVACDPEARPAALAAARLLRRGGEWTEAAAVLRRAAESRGDAAERAELCLELGRVLSGPLEDLPGALDAFDRACALAPARLDAREARAAVLAHLPGRCAEALAELALVLESAPLRTDAVRRAARLLAGRGDERGAARGLAILRALGVTSPLEHDTAPDRLDLACAAALPALDGAAEELRQAAAALARLVAHPALEATPVDGTPADDGGAAPAAGTKGSAPAAWLGAARRLVGAPELLDLDASRLRGVLGAMLADARAGRLGREGSRAVRRLEERILERVDLVAWGTALRTRAWAEAADALEGDLRSVLLAMAAGRGAPEEPGLDLSPWLGEIPEALALLRALGQAWLRGAAD